jgi:CRISPR-associated endonuclease/helicase Cas3
MSEAMKLETLLHLWAKTDRDRPEAYHPLLFHMLDVAAVAQVLWDSVLPAPFQTRLAGRWRLTEQASRDWVTFLAGLHDIGKATPDFQGQAGASKRGELQQYGFSFSTTRDPHGIWTSRIVREMLINKGMPPGDASSLAAFLGGHHGRYPKAAEFTRLPFLRNTPWEASWQPLASSLANSICENPDHLQHLPILPKDHAFLILLSGFVTVADWLGSDEEIFQCVDDGTSLAEYIPLSRKRANDAIHRLGWDRWKHDSKNLTFQGLFPLIEKPRDLQEKVACLLDMEGCPRLLLVEAPMGEGKTEAALFAAERSLGHFGQKGLYFALPSKATSNQMFKRVKLFLGDRYRGQVLDLELLHSYALLTDSFLKLRIAALGEPSKSHDEESPAEIIAAEWFSPKRRGILAPFGVGTIDQALMSVLSTKHFFLRLFGLAGKTVIVDEVHAYDAYMSHLLDRLLEWLAALDCTVVLLSATLPNSRREEMVAAFRKGLGIEEASSRLTAAYPRITWIDEEGHARDKVVLASKAGQKDLNLRWIPGIQDPRAIGALGETLQLLLSDGGCAAVICNTVSQAQLLYEGLRSYFPADSAEDGQPELGLLHARFPFERREELEIKAIKRFGHPNSDGVRRPHRAVLVATQVIEQSLDLDFDVMVSDFAPVDLLLQRSGRLFRHERPERPKRFSIPTLWLLAPSLDGQCSPNFGKGTEAVYDRYILLRTWHALGEGNRDAIRVPDEVEELIEAVYSQKKLEGLGANEDQALSQAWNGFQKYRTEAEEKGNEKLIRSPRGGFFWEVGNGLLEEDSPGIHEAHQALTRDAGPGATILCVHRKGPNLFWDAEGTSRFIMQSDPGQEGIKKLLRKTLSISNPAIVKALLEKPLPKAWKRNAFLRHVRLLEMTDGEVTLAERTLRLDSELGLVIEKNE